MKKKIRDIKREERRYKRMLKRLIRSGRIPDTISSQSVLLDYGIFTPNKRITNNNTEHSRRGSRTAGYSRHSWRLRKDLRFYFFDSARF